MSGYAPHARASGLQEEVTLRQRNEASSYLDSIARRLRAMDLSVQTRVIVQRQVASAILEAAHTYGIDLIALATRGRGAVVRHLVGSISDKVLRGAEVPLLIHRPA